MLHTRGEMMKCWSGVSDNIGSFVGWRHIYGDDRVAGVDFPKNLRMFGICAEWMLWPEEYSKFSQICGDATKEIFMNEFKDWRFFWYTGVEYKSYQPRVSQYRKVWKELKRHWDLEGFSLGPEIETILHYGKYFVSIAEFDVLAFPKAEIFANMLFNGVIMASRRFDLRSEQLLKELSSFAHIEKETFWDFDYVSLIKKLCPQGDIVFVYENDFENRKLCMAFEEDKTEIFGKYVKKYV